MLFTTRSILISRIFLTEYPCIGISFREKKKECLDLWDIQCWKMFHGWDVKERCSIDQMLPTTWDHRHCVTHLEVLSLFFLIHFYHYSQTIYLYRLIKYKLIPLCYILNFKIVFLNLNRCYNTWFQPIFFFIILHFYE